MDEQLISGLEKLARLQPDTAEHKRLVRDLENILQMVDKLRELDTQGVEPLTHLVDTPQSWLADRIQKPLTQAEALQNAPQHDGQFFRTPKVIE